MSNQNRRQPNVLPKAQINDPSIFTHIGLSAFNRVTGLFGKSEKPATKIENAQLTWQSFETVTHPDKTKSTFLYLGYSEGFQIWDTTSLDKIQEVLSFRDVHTHVHCMRLLPEVDDTQKNPDKFEDARPLIAIVVGSEENQKEVRFFSIKKHQFLGNAYKCSEPIINVQASGHAIVVLTSRSAHVLDAGNPVGKPAIVLKTAHSINPLGVASLSSRWLAYPGDEAVPNNTFSQTVTDKFVGMARGAFWAVGTKTVSVVSEYSQRRNSNPESPKLPAPQPQLEQSEFAGTIVVFDVAERRKIAHFQAHALPLQLLKFDPTGTLLVSVSQDGHNFKVFRIHDCNGAAHVSYLYKLNRSMIVSALIQDVAFSPDSRWIAFSSQGNTHSLFAINPSGGSVSTYTHIRPQSLSALQESHLRDLTVLTEHPDQRIVSSLAQLTPPTDPAEQNAPEPKAVPRATFVHNNALESMDFLAVDQRARLFHYKLKPQGTKPAPNVDPSSLQLTYEASGKWEIVQPLTTWSSLPAELPQVPKEDHREEWESQVELTTHNPYLRPLHTSPQFTLTALARAMEPTAADVRYEQMDAVPTLTIKDRLLLNEAETVNPKTGQNSNSNSTNQSDITFPTLSENAPEMELLRQALHTNISESMENQQQLPPRLSIDNNNSNSTIDDYSIENRPIETRPVDNRPVDNRPVDNRPVDNRPVDSRPIDNRPVDSRPVDNRPVDNRPVDNRPVQSHPVDNEPKSSVNHPANENTQGHSKKKKKQKKPSNQKEETEIF